MKSAPRARVPWWIVASPLVAFSAAVIYAGAEVSTATSGATFWSVLALCFAAAAASLIVGALVGFLFGFPRTSENPGSTSLLTTNTNLDQISDWLTKILVGLGLVQFGKIIHGINDLATSLAPGLGEGSGAQPFAFGLLVYAAVDGFLLGYLWARTVASSLFLSAAEELASSLLNKGIVLEAKLQEEVLSTPPPAAPPTLPPPPPSPEPAAPSLLP
jgi:hypothetical protein